MELNSAHHQIYHIQNKSWTASIASDIGANVVELKHNGKDILFPLMSESQLHADPFVMGSPILLPANLTALGRFKFEGKAYQLALNNPHGNANLHGQVHEQLFTVDSQAESEITLSFENTHQIYPFPFCLTVTYQLEDDGFQQSYCIENTGGTNMPFTFALHTTFVEPGWFQVPIDRHQISKPGLGCMDQYEPLSEDFQKYVSGSASKDVFVGGYFSAGGHTAQIGAYRYTVSENFDHWILYNAQGKGGFLCIEPQCGAVNGLNLPNRHCILGPGEKMHFHAHIYPAE